MPFNGIRDGWHRDSVLSRAALLHFFFLMSLSSTRCAKLPENLIDERFALVISNSEGDNYFGASASILQDGSDIWVFIGEPKGNASTRSLEPAVIRKCQIVPVLFCEDLEVGTSGAFGQLGQSWFGGSMITVGGSVVASAHHLVTKDKEEYGMPGSCYRYQKNSKESQNVTVPGEYFGTELKMAAFGMSLHRVNDNELIAGAPVFHYGFGAIGTISTSDLKKISWVSGEDANTYFGYAVSSGKYFGDGKTYYVGGLPRQNELKGKVVVFQPSPCYEIACSNIKIEEHKSLSGFHVGSYFGSVLFSQDIDGDGSDELFVGAPLSCHWDNMEQFRSQSQNTGYVGRNKGNRNHRDNGCVYVYNKTSDGNDLEVVQVLTGRRVPYARFGTAISALEGYRSFGSAVIVVGAPYENNYGGAIYFYEGRKILSAGEYGKRIAAGDRIFAGLPRPFQGFGYSLSQSKDIDGNLTPDIIIGSYRSAQVLVLKTRPYVELLPTEVYYIDEPDNIPLNDSSLKIKVNKNFILKLYVLCRFKLSNLPELARIRQNGSLVVWTRLKVDTDFRRFEIRVRDLKLPPAYLDYGQSIEFGIQLGSNYDDRSKKYGDTTIQYKATVDVTPIQGYENTLSDIQPLKLSVQSWLNESSSYSPSIFSYDIRNGSGSGSWDQSLFHPFVPASISTEESFYGPIQLLDECRHPGFCDGNVIITNPSFYSAGRQIQRLAAGASSEVILRWTLKNEGSEKADKPFTFLSWTHSSITLVSQACERLESDRYRCNHTGSIPSKKFLTAEAKFRIPNEYLKGSTHSNLSVKLSSSFGTEKENKFGKPVELELFVDSHVTLRGTSVEMALGDLTVPPKITYQVLLNGNSSIEKFELAFMIPRMQENDSEILIDVYSEDVKTISGDFQNHSCTSSEPFFGPAYPPNPTALPPGPSTQQPVTMQPGKETGFGGDTTTNKYVDNGRRKRRSVDEERRNTSRLAFDPNSTITLNCGGNDAKCFLVNCTFQNVTGRTNIKIEFRLNIRNNTFDLLSEKLNTLLISSTGVAKILDGVGSRQAGNFSEIKMVKMKDIEPAPAPMWLYIVAILGGLLLLVLIFGVLYKCGFFKRDFKEKLDELKSQTEGGVAGEGNNAGRENLPLRESSSSDHLLDE